MMCANKSYSIFTILSLPLPLISRSLAVRLFYFIFFGAAATAVVVVVVTTTVGGESSSSCVPLVVVWGKMKSFSLTFDLVDYRRSSVCRV
jgi:hypothetical protein